MGAVRGDHLDDDGIKVQVVVGAASDPDGGGVRDCLDGWAEAGGDDVFAHFSAIQMEGFRTLKQGGQVSFDLVQGPKGQLAHNITELAGARAAPAQSGASNMV